MSYTLDPNGDIIVNGFERGIANSPHRGIANMQNVNISTETGEALCSFSRVLQSQDGSSGTLTRVNTNTVTISGITLLVGQVITIVNAGTTGLSGDYYYLSTGKLYSGSNVPNNPDGQTAVTGIAAGSATFTVKYPLAKPIQKAEEIYRDSDGDLQQRYFILDSIGTLWCHDTVTLSNWDTPLWFVVGTEGVGASGLAVINGWVVITDLAGLMYWKLTSLLGTAFVQRLSYSTSFFHSTLVGHQGKMYGTDGNFITSLFPSTSLVTGAANIQSYGKMSASLGTEAVTNGTFTGGTAGWTVGAAWQYGTNNVIKYQDGTSTLEQDLATTLSTNRYGLLVSFTISSWSVGTVTPSFNGINGTARGANGTFTQLFTMDATLSDLKIIFTPTNTARFTIDDVSVKPIVNEVDYLIGGSLPTVSADTTTGIIETSTVLTRIPIQINTDGTLPTDLTAGSTYYVQWNSDRTFSLYSSVTSRVVKNTITGGSGNLYFDTFSPRGSSAPLYTYTPQRLNLPFNEVAQCMGELGNQVIIGGATNILYPWDQVSPLPSDLIYMPENDTKKMVTVNNTMFVFAGQKGNIYMTNGSAVSLALSVPDYCAGIPGTPATYIEPYFTWGDAMFCRGRVFFSIQDQTATKAGNCGGIWSFTPTQNFFVGQDTGQALHLEGTSSYDTYDGACSLLIPAFNQSAISAQFWSGWYSDTSLPLYGIDFTDTITAGTTVIETDLIPTGTMLEKKTFRQIEYKLSTPQAVGETIAISYRKNSTEAWTALSSAIVDTTSDLSGYFDCSFERTQWLQLQITLTPLSSSASTFLRLVELRIR